MNKTILITGATSGFGKAMALLFASHGCRIIITGRRQERLAALQTQLEQEHNTTVLALNFDVRNQAEVEQVLQSISDEWKQVDVLINNAGLALGREPVHEALLSDWEEMIDTNLKGLLYVTREVSKWMVTRKSGHIINIGSVAGKEAYAGGNVYSATKFAVDALTKSMRIDFLPHNIRVSQIAPGAAETEFSLVRFHGDERKAKAVYQGFIPLSADDIADAAWYVASRPMHVCINDLVIMPTAQANAQNILRS
ncbi:MAG: SDR family NAD(P)-dependent oxidoreductase [Flavobacteriales bacterium]